MVEKSDSSLVQAPSSGGSRKRQLSSVHSSVTTYCWQIVDFKKQWMEVRNNDKDLFSDTFSLISRPKIRLALAFESTEEVWSENWYGLIVKDLGGNETVEINDKFWFENEQGQKLSVQEFSNITFDANNKASGYSNLKGKDVTLFTSLYDNHETLYFCCQIIDLNPLLEDEHEEFHMNHWTLFEREEHDAIIKVGKTEFKVLKNYFIVQSEVFARMFSANFKEGQTGVVEIKDINVETMKALIKWLYTGQLEDESPTSDLFIAADKYGIKILKKLCVRRLCSTLSKETVIWDLKIAVMHSEDKLKDSALLCIAQMSATEMAKMLIDPNWTEFTRKNVAVSDEVNKLIGEKMAESESESESE